MRFTCWLLTIPLLISTSLGANWYVDSAATGLNNGKAWSDAWTNLNNIAWNNLLPGDTVEIAQGNYPEGLVVRGSGAPGAPITFQLATDPAHHGHVFLGAIGHGSRNWITINGALNPAFVPPAPVAAMFGIINNIGIHIHGTGPGIYSGGANTGVRLLWIEVNNCGHYSAANTDGIHLELDQAQCEIAYCWLHDNIYGDTITYNTNTHPAFGGLSIHDCFMDNTGDDMMQLAPGTDVYRCLMQHRVYGQAHGHTDCFQTWGSYYRIHHNIVRNFADFSGVNGYNSISYAQFSEPIVGNFLFYDNLLYNDDVNYLTNPGLMLSFDAWWSPGKHNANQVITNIVIANNLFNLPNAQVMGWTLYGAATDSSRGTNDAYTIVNCLVANNIMLDSYSWTANEMGTVAFGLPGPVSNPVPQLPGDPPSVFVTTSSLPLLHNIFTGPNRRISYMGINSADPVQTFRTTGMTDNWTSKPSFVSYTMLSAANLAVANDFHLLAADTVARDHGYDLGAYANVMPLLNVDLDGNPRGYGGGWDIGPYEYGPFPDLFSIWTNIVMPPVIGGVVTGPGAVSVPSNEADGKLILKLTFSDTDWTKGYLIDSSGRENHGYEFGHGGQINWPSKVFRGTNQCGAFREIADPTIPMTGVAGDYVAVTNLADFAVTTQLTLGVWAYFDRSQDANGNPISWDNNGSATILSAGYGNTNAWELGRNGTRAPEFRIWTDNTAGGYLSYQFKDTFDNYGQSDEWHHYAVTFDSGRIILYQDGQPYQTNTTVSLPTIGTAGGWIAIGCRTHGASIWSTPQFGDDAYPNNGWMHGKIDDVLIYRRALSSAEIQVLYVSTATRPSTPRNLRRAGL